MDAQFYEHYRRQNPTKYARKFGDLTPEEVAAGFRPEPPVAPTGIKTEFRSRLQGNNLEVNFAPEPEATEPVADPPQEEAKTKAVKKKK